MPPSILSKYLGKMPKRGRDFLHAALGVRNLCPILQLRGRRHCPLDMYGIFEALLDCVELSPVLGGRVTETETLIVIA